MTPLPNRIAVYLTSAAALAAALAPVVADLDIESVAGIAAGLAAISAVVYKWLDGWQKYEARGDQPDDLALIDVDEEPPDDFDETTAEPIPDSMIADPDKPGAVRPPNVGPPGTPPSPPPLPPEAQR